MCGMCIVGDAAIHIFFVLAHDWLREIFKMYFLINIALLAIT